MPLMNRNGVVVHITHADAHNSGCKYQPAMGFAWIVTLFNRISANGLSPGPVGVCKTNTRGSSRVKVLID